MDRQLSVWAAPGLILFLALLAFVFGHPPRAAAPRAQTEVAVAPPQAPPARPVAPPQEVPKAESKPAEPAEPKPGGARPPEPKPEAEPGKEKEQETEDADPAPPAAPAEQGGGPSGKVAGRIVYDGTPPAPKPPAPLPEEHFEQCCGAQFDGSDRSLLVSSDGGVANVVVTIKAKGAEVAGAAPTVEMDQKCCVFEPRVLLVPAGATVRYKNSDDTNHNVNIKALKNPKANNNLAPGSSMDLAVPKDEEFEIGCDIHPWMEAHVVAVKFTTAGVSGSDGRFEIDGVPAGEWTVELWAQSVKPVVKGSKVKVEAGATTTAEFRVTAKPAR